MSHCCSDCQRFMELANTAETGMGICSYPNEFFQVKADGECIFELGPYSKCGECHRQENDDACFTTTPDTNAILNDGHLCPGFISLADVKVEEAIFEYFSRGLSPRAEIDKILKRASETYEIPFQSKSNTKEN